MNNLTSLELARTAIADAERRWLYGHPYRSDRRTTRPTMRLRDRFAI